MANTVKTPKMGNEIASIGAGRDITRPYIGPLLQSFDSILNLRGGGDLQLYEEVYSDAQVKSVFEQRQKAVVQCEWKVDPASDDAIDVKAAEFLKQQLDNIGWDRVTNLMLFGIFYGYSVAELIYERQNNTVGLSKIKVRDRKRFRFDDESRLRLLTPDNMFQGELVEAPYFWHFATGADHDDEPYGRGLAHWLYWPVFFKRHGLKSWLTFLDKFAVPTAVGKYDPRSANAEERRNLLSAGAALGNDAAVIIPHDMQLELIEAARSGVSDYRSLHDAMDGTMAKVVLGQTASTQGTPGKLGNEDLQGDVRQDLIKADADIICESFNLGPARWLTAWNFSSAQPPTVMRVTEVSEDLLSRANRDESVARTTGYRPTLNYVQETYGGEWEDPKIPVAGLDRNTPVGFAAPIATLQKDPSLGSVIAAQARLDNAIESIPMALYAEITDPLVVPVIAAIKNGATDEEAAELLLESIPDMNTQKFAETLANAIFVADLWGQLSSQQVNNE
jgi:phage gp29-like protein